MMNILLSTNCKSDQLYFATGRNLARYSDILLRSIKGTVQIRLTMILRSGKRGGTFLLDNVASKKGCGVEHGVTKKENGTKRCVINDY